MRSLFFALLLLAPVSAQPWLKPKLLVVPGKSLGPITLGKPIPKETFRLLGPATGNSDVQQNTHKDNAAIEWLAKDLYIRVKCHDGRRPENAYQIFWTAPNPRTAEGLGVGSPVASVLKKYPKGKWTTDDLDGYPTWTTPGLNWMCDAKKTRVVEMHLIRE